jgi:nucleoside transporter
MLGGFETGSGAGEQSERGMEATGSGASGGSGTGGVVVRLAAMMFLQFFVWGAWYVTLGPYMVAAHMSAGIGDAYSVAPIGAILAPLFLGLIADRYFPTQRVLGVMHLLGGAALLAAPSVASALPVREVVGEGGAVTQVRDHLPFVGVLLLHTLCYMPTLGLSNTLAFHNLSNREKQFPIVRVLGTIGWIVAGFAIAFAARQAAPGSGPEAEAARSASPVFFYVAGGAGLLLGVFSFTLPRTPPPARGKRFSARDALGLDAIALLRDRSFAVFVLCSLLLCVPLAAYYAYAGVFAGAVGLRVGGEDVPVSVVMSAGQMSEIVFMLLMPLAFARLGVKWMLLVGMLAWVARYVLFAGAWDTTDPAAHVQWMMLAGILLHGICYDFFFVTGSIYTDQRAPVQVRAQAQGFLVLITQGLGMLIGAQVFPAVVKAYTGAGGAVDWSRVWLVPAAAAGVIAAVFFVGFRGERKG